MAKEKNRKDKKIHKRIKRNKMRSRRRDKKYRIVIGGSPIPPEQELDIRKKLKEHKNKMIDEITQNNDSIDAFFTEVCDSIEYDQKMKKLVEEKREELKHKLQERKDELKSKELNTELNDIEQLNEELNLSFREAATVVVAVGKLAPQSGEGETQPATKTPKLDEIYTN